MSLKDVVIAIDVGGTTIKAGLVNRENEILARQNFSYVATNFDAEIQECVKKLIKNSKEKDLEVVGLSVGLPEYIKDHQIMSNMVVDWNSATTSKIKALVGSELGRDVAILIESDVRCGAIGEFSKIEKKLVSSLLYVSWGTGISSTIVLPDGSCLSGLNGEALSFGEWEIDDLQGNTSILEKVVSGNGISEQFNNLFKKKLSALEINEEASAGNIEAQGFLVKIGSILGSEIAKFALVLDPDEIILGGGIGSSDSLLRNSAVAQYQKVYPRPKPASVMPARFKSDSGLLGAAIAGFNFLQGRT
jgi:glucokinase